LGNGMYQKTLTFLLCSITPFDLIKILCHGHRQQYQNLVSVLVQFVMHHHRCHHQYHHYQHHHHL